MGPDPLLFNICSPFISIYHLKSNLDLQKFAQIVRSLFSETIALLILEVGWTEKANHQRIIPSEYFKTNLCVKKFQ